MHVHRRTCNTPVTGCYRRRTLTEVLFAPLSPATERVASVLFTESTWQATHMQATAPAADTSIQVYGHIGW